MLASILYLLAGATTSTGALALIGDAEREVAGCGLAKVIPAFKVGAPDSPKERWSVERVKLADGPLLSITVAVPGASGEWRSWLVTPACRAIGLRLDTATGAAEFLYRLDAPPSPIERESLLARASYEPCDPEKDEHRPLPSLPEFPPPSAEADATPPLKEPKISALGPVAITWRSGIYRDPKVCWQKEDEPPTRAKSSKPSDFIAGGPRYRLSGVAGFQDGCTGLKGCQPFAIEVAGHRVRMLSTLGKPGMSLLVIEDQTPRRYSTPFAIAGEARILGLYQGLLWVLLPVIKAPNFTLAALDLKAGHMWRVALEPIDDWSLARTSASALLVRNAELQEQFDEAEGSVDKKRLDQKFPAVTVEWKTLAASLPKARP